MTIRSSVLGTMMMLAIGAGACSGDDSSAPAGTGGGTGGATGSGGAGGGSGGTGGGATGGAAGTGGRADASAGGSGGGTSDAAADRVTVEAGPPLTCGPFADGGADSRIGIDAPDDTMSFFVSSQTNMTGDLGGLAGADTRCQDLAEAVGAGDKTWHAYLSTSTINARDRIGQGPWFNALGVMVAADLTSLHARRGDAAVFLDENGNMINGQWTGSPGPTQHDILTGSNADGTVAVGKTCQDWTSAVGPGDAGTPDGGDLRVARIGHTDGYGGMCSTAVNATAMTDVTSWNSAHDNAGCDNTVPRGGAGRIYCFALDTDDAGD